MSSLHGHHFVVLIVSLMLHIRCLSNYKNRLFRIFDIMPYYLADCPAVSLDLCIYTAGGGNPLYREELLKQCSSVKNKAIGLIFFAELESYMHKVDVEANKWRKKWWKPTEKCPKSAIFHPLAWIAVLKPHFRPTFQARNLGHRKLGHCTMLPLSTRMLW